MSKTILFMQRHAQATCDAARWDESKHKRDNGGRFSTTGGGGKTSKEKKKGGGAARHTSATTAKVRKQAYSVLEGAGISTFKNKGNSNHHSGFMPSRGKCWINVVESHETGKAVKALKKAGFKGVESNGNSIFFNP